jgi:predicted acetyltransferase
VGEIRKLVEQDFADVVQVFANAYPGMKLVTDEDMQRAKRSLLELHDEPTAEFYGYIRGGELLGIMCLHDFVMNLLHSRITAGGVGQVAVHLAHKKEHIGKELMSFALRHYRLRRTPLALLYPFRPDFYRRMGFGYGTKMNQYCLAPMSLPRGPSKSHIRLLGLKDREAVIGCYNRFMDRTHGIMAKTEREIKRLFERPRQQIAGYVDRGRILGYLVFSFEYGETWLSNDINVGEFVYETPEVLSELLTFLYSQADQVRRIIVNTQDELFHHLLVDPCSSSGGLIPHVYHETNIQGLGIMYRIIDVPGIFERLHERDFGAQSCTIRLSVDDSFLPENSSSILLCFKGGYLQSIDDGPHDAKVSLDIADFSSLLLGTVDFRTLVKYGLARISDATRVDVVHHLFAVDEKPVCTTPF